MRKDSSDSTTPAATVFCGGQGENQWRREKISASIPGNTEGVKNDAMRSPQVPLNNGIGGLLWLSLYLYRPYLQRMLCTPCCGDFRVTRDGQPPWLTAPSAHMYSI